MAVRRERIEVDALLDADEVFLTNSSWHVLPVVRLEQRMAIAGAARFLEHVLRLPVDFFSHRYPGDIAQRLESVEMLSDLLAARIAPAAVGLHRGRVPQRRLHDEDLPQAWRRGDPEG